MEEKIIHVVYHIEKNVTKCIECPYYYEAQDMGARISCCCHPNNSNILPRSSREIDKRCPFLKESEV